MKFELFGYVVTIEKKDAKLSDYELALHLLGLAMVSRGAGGSWKLHLIKALRAHDTSFGLKDSKLEIERLFTFPKNPYTGFNEHPEIKVKES